MLGDLHNKRTLEIGCGNGRSIKYIHDKGAKELWGIDISTKQLKRSKNFLNSQGIKAKLICVPMEKECEIPNNYFDLIYSVFGIGWSTDLQKTFSLIHSYLKKDGKFVFSWSHPIHKCVYPQNGKYIFGNSYFDEKWYSADMCGKEIMLSNRKLSTYINTLSDCGFKIERLIEDSDKNLLESENSEFSIKARKMPVLFVIKASKI